MFGTAAGKVRAFSAGGGKCIRAITAPAPSLDINDLVMLWGSAKFDVTNNMRISRMVVPECGAYISHPSASHSPPFASPPLAVGRLQFHWTFNVFQRHWPRPRPLLPDIRLRPRPGTCGVPRIGPNAAWPYFPVVQPVQAHDLRWSLRVRLVPCKPKGGSPPWLSDFRIGFIFWLYIVSSLPLVCPMLRWFCLPFAC